MKGISVSVDMEAEEMGIEACFESNVGLEIENSYTQDSTDVNVGTRSRSELPFDERDDHQEYPQDGAATEVGSVSRDAPTASKAPANIPDCDTHPKSENVKGAPTEGRHGTGKEPMFLMEDMMNFGKQYVNDDMVKLSKQFVEEDLANFSKEFVPEDVANFGGKFVQALTGERTPGSKTEIVDEKTESKVNVREQDESQMRENSRPEGAEGAGSEMEEGTGSQIRNYASDQLDGTQDKASQGQEEVTPLGALEIESEETNHDETKSDPINEACGPHASPSLEKKGIQEKSEPPRDESHGYSSVSSDVDDLERPEIHQTSEEFPGDLVPQIQPSEEFFDALVPTESNVAVIVAETANSDTLFKNKDEVVHNLPSYPLLSEEFFDTCEPPSTTNEAAISIQDPVMEGIELHMHETSNTEGLLHIKEPTQTDILGDHEVSWDTVKGTPKDCEEGFASCNEQKITKFDLVDESLPDMNDDQALQETNTCVEVDRNVVTQDFVEAAEEVRVNNQGIQESFSEDHSSSVHDGNDPESGLDNMISGDTESSEDTHDSQESSLHQAKEEVTSDAVEVPTDLEEPRNTSLSCEDVKVPPGVVDRSTMNEEASSCQVSQQTIPLNAAANPVSTNGETMDQAIFFNGNKSSSTGSFDEEKQVDTQPSIDEMKHEETRESLAQGESSELTDQQYSEQLRCEVSTEVDDSVGKVQEGEFATEFVKKMRDPTLDHRDTGNPEAAVIEIGHGNKAFIEESVAMKVEVASSCSHFEVPSNVEAADTQMVLDQDLIEEVKNSSSESNSGTLLCKEISDDDALANESSGEIPRTETTSSRGSVIESVVDDNQQGSSVVTEFVGEVVLETAADAEGLRDVKPSLTGSMTIDESNNGMYGCVHEECEQLGSDALTGKAGDASKHFQASNLPVKESEQTQTQDLHDGPGMTYSASDVVAGQEAVGVLSSNEQEKTQEEFARSTLSDIEEEPGMKWAASDISTPPEATNQQVIYLERVNCERLQEIQTLQVQLSDLEKSLQDTRRELALERKRVFNEKVTELKSFLEMEKRRNQALETSLSARQELLDQERRAARLSHQKVLSMEEELEKAKQENQALSASMEKFKCEFVAELAERDASLQEKELQIADQQSQIREEQDKIKLLQSQLKEKAEAEAALGEHTTWSEINKRLEETGKMKAELERLYQEKEAQLAENSNLMKVLEESNTKKEKLIQSQQENVEALERVRREKETLLKESQRVSEQLEEACQKKMSLSKTEEEQIQQLRDLKEERAALLEKEEEEIKNLDYALARKQALLELEQMESQTLEQTIAQKNALLECEAAKVRDLETTCAKKESLLVSEQNMTKALQAAKAEKEGLLEAEREIVNNLYRAQSQKEVLLEMQKKAQEEIKKRIEETELWINAEKSAIKEAKNVASEKKTLLANLDDAVALVEDRLAKKEYYLKREEDLTKTLEEFRLHRQRISSSNSLSAIVDATLSVSRIVTEAVHPTKSTQVTTRKDYTERALVMQDQMLVSLKIFMNALGLKGKNYLRAKTYLAHFANFLGFNFDILPKNRRKSQA